MVHSRILNICLICLSVAACYPQQQTAAVNKTTEITTVPEITAKQIPTPIISSPAINLSIDSMPVERQNNDDNFLSADKNASEKNTTLFKTLSKNQIEPRINLSGNLITDKDKFANKEYLDSVEGMQINIEGSFN